MKNIANDAIAQDKKRQLSTTPALDTVKPTISRTTRVATKMAARRIHVSLGLLLFFVPASTAILTLSSMAYTLAMSDLKIGSRECGIGRFREPDTVFTMAMTDAYSEYIYVAFPTDRMAKIEGELPYSLFSVFTTYDDYARVVEPYGSLLDSDLILDGGNPNPYVDGNMIGSEPRSYTIYASKEKPEYATNWLSTDTGEDDQRISIFILRVVGEYGDAQGLSSGKWVPNVSLLDDDGNQVYCRFLKDQGEMPILSDTYPTPIAKPDACTFQTLFDADSFPDFSFYPLSRTVQAFANVADGAYVTAELDYEPDNADMLAFVIEFKNPPQVFSPGVGHPLDGPFDSTAYDVRYTSICFYMNFIESPDGINCVKGMDIYEMYVKHGVAYIAGGDPSLQEHFAEKGVPFLRYETSDTGANALGRFPFFIYRVQFPSNPDYDVDSNVPRWDGVCNEQSTNGYYKADNEENWGDMAPIGRQCSSADLVGNGCGFAAFETILKAADTGHGRSRERQWFKIFTL
jgi:hypothetical protein